MFTVHVGRTYVLCARRAYACSTFKVLYAKKVGWSQQDVYRSWWRGGGHEFLFRKSTSSGEEVVETKKKQ
jgi:hypothetical protein